MKNELGSAAPTPKNPLPYTRQVTTKNGHKFLIMSNRPLEQAITDAARLGRQMQAKLPKDRSQPTP